MATFNQTRRDRDHRQETYFRTANADRASLKPSVRSPVRLPRYQSRRLCQITVENRDYHHLSQNATVAHANSESRRPGSRVATLERANVASLPHRSSFV